jgi:hypothetical protein
MTYPGRLARYAITRSLCAAAVVGACACSGPEIGTLRPELAFRIGGESGLTAARDITVDRDGNVFIFDYGDYVIRKFDPRGTQLAFFGGTGEEPGLFQHLMAIKVQGDSLLALDAGSISVFDLSGELRARKLFVETIVCDLPRISSDGRWAGEWIIDESAEKAFMYRGTNGSEAARLASYALSEFFPGVEPFYYPQVS